MNRQPKESLYGFTLRWLTSRGQRNSAQPAQASVSGDSSPSEIADCRGPQPVARENSPDGCLLEAISAEYHSYFGHHPLVDLAVARFCNDFQAREKSAGPGSQQKGLTGLRNPAPEPFARCETVLDYHKGYEEACGCLPIGACQKCDLVLCELCVKYEPCPEGGWHAL